MEPACACDRKPSWSNILCRILSGSYGADSVVQLWDSITGTPMIVLEGHSDCVLSVAFSQDDAGIGSGSEDGQYAYGTQQQGYLQQFFMAIQVQSPLYLSRQIVHMLFLHLLTLP